MPRKKSESQILTEQEHEPQEDAGITTPSESPTGEDTADAEYISESSASYDGEACEYTRDVPPEEDAAVKYEDAENKTRTIWETAELITQDEEQEADPQEELDTPVSDEHTPAADNADNSAASAEDKPIGEAAPKAKRARKKTIFDLDLRDIDRDLSEEERREWSAIYASFRARSVLTGTAIGADQNSFDIFNRDTGENEKRTLSSLVIIDYRVKILIPESEMWMPGEERPSHVLRNMVGSLIDYVILEVDREGGCAVASRRAALAAKRHYFASARTGHREGELLKCRVLAVGAKRCTVECSGYDLRLSQRDLSYTAIPDLRAKYHPGQELACKLKEYDKEAGLVISVKEVNPNPFDGADRRHPPGSRRQAVISGKYAGGVFCNLPDDTVCLCLYSSQHSDSNFSVGDSVIIVIREYDYGRQLIFGRILAKW